MKKFLTLALAATLATASAADAPPLQPVANPAPILEDLQRKMSSLDSVYLEFTQERNLNLFAEPLRSEGVMLIARPDQIRWETIEPFQSILLGDHSSVAQFEKADGVWRKLKPGFSQMLRHVMAQMVQMNEGKLDALTGDYTISVATGTNAVLTLVPKDKTVREMLEAIEVTMPLDFSATRQVLMREPSGESTRIIFRKELRNVKFPPGTFDQAKPLDIAVVKGAVQNPP